MGTKKSTAKRTEAQAKPEPTPHALSPLTPDPQERISDVMDSVMAVYEVLESLGRMIVEHVAGEDNPMLRGLGVNLTMLSEKLGGTWDDLLKVREQLPAGGAR